jgi:outer membrane protein OmpA-like peptidoglycan-associated protein
MLGLDPTVRVVGQVDGSGTPGLNESLMARRAGAYRDLLIRYGVPSSMLVIDTSSIPEQNVPDLNKRRAVLKMSATTSQEQ